MKRQTGAASLSCRKFVRIANTVNPMCCSWKRTGLFLIEMRMDATVMSITTVFQLETPGIPPPRHLRRAKRPTSLPSSTTFVGTGWLAGWLAQYILVVIMALPAASMWHSITILCMFSILSTICPSKHSHSSVETEGAETVASEEPTP